MVSELDCPPPPTINNLDRQQRMRLVRTNRKLEAVLGAAPYYLEPTSTEFQCTTDIAKSSRREGRIFGHSPSSSFSSSTTSVDSLEKDLPRRRNLPAPPPVKVAPALPVGSKKGPRAKELSRPLLLRLRSVPVPPSDNNRIHAALLSPQHLPPIAPISPISPTFTINLEKLQATSLESRRKKMAKLTRTLGENIPPELVFPSPAMGSDEKARAGGVFLPPPPCSAPVPITPSQNKPTERIRTRTISRPRAKAPRSKPKIPPPPSSVAPIPTTTLPALSNKPGTTSFADRRRKPRPRSLSLSTGTDMLVAAAAANAHAETKAATKRSPVVHTETVTVRSASIDTHHIPMSSKAQYLTVDEKATKDIFESNSPLPFQAVVTPPSTAAATTGRPTKEPWSHSKSASMSISTSKSKSKGQSEFHRRRKEVGWSGEWNQDMGEVLKNLRNLKAR